MKLIIDIDKEDFKIMKHNIAVNNPLCPLSQEEMVSKVANGIPLEDIKAEIEQMNNIDYVEPVTVDEVLEIINKHIGDTE